MASPATNKTIAESTWKKIKSEYCIGGASMRSLSRKYKVSVSTISKKAKDEQWKQTCEHIEQTVSKSMVEETTDILCDFNRAYLHAVLTMGQKVSAGIEAVDMRDDKAMRNYMAILKDLKDIGVFRSRLDVEEQEARIAKLKKECEEVEVDNTITVVIDDSLKDYTN